MSEVHIHPKDFISKVIEVESCEHNQAIDKIQTLLERGYININPEGYVEMTQRENGLTCKLGYSRIGRNNV